MGNANRTKKRGWFASSAILRLPMKRWAVRRKGLFAWKIWLQQDATGGFGLFKTHFFE